MHTDVLILGGSFAGLSCALYLGRARRSVRIIDAGAPRNRFAEHAHGLLSQDGREPTLLLADAIGQALEYPSVALTQGVAIRAERRERGFTVRLQDGREFSSDWLVLAYGIRDELPALRGLAERWGRSVLHCPYCHGYEFSERPLGVLNSTELSVHQAQLIAEWGPTTFFLDRGPQHSREALDLLRARGIHIEETPLRSLHGDGTGLDAVELIDGRRIALNALYIAPRNRLNSDIAEQLGCGFEDQPLGRVLQTDSMKATTIPGVYAAGDITRGAHSITWACSDGMTAAVAIHRAMVFPAAA